MREPTWLSSACLQFWFSDFSVSIQSMLSPGADSSAMTDTSFPCSVLRHSLKPFRASSVLLLLFLSMPAMADEDQCTEWQANTGETAQSDSSSASAARSGSAPASRLVFGRITVRTNDLFDLENKSENAFVHSAANALHLNTRQVTIFNALPFAEGDAFSEERMLEAERILRGKRYLRDAFVTPHRLCGNRVDVEIKTVDNWTLTPSVSFGSAGGQTRYSFEIQDLNVLGLGKEFTLRNSRSGDEQRTLFNYRDDNVLGSRYRFGVEISEVEGQQGYSIQGGLPFYAENAAHSWQVSAHEVSRSLSYSSAYGAVDIPDYSLTSKVAELHVARRLPSSSLPFARLGGGVRFAQDQTGDQVSGQDVQSESDYEESYPFLSAQWSESKWLRRQNFLGIRSIEDIDLGLSVSAEAGLIFKGLGNDEDALRLSLDLSKGWYAGASALHKFTFHQLQYFSNREVARKQISARYQFFRWLSDVDQLDLRLTAETQDGYSAFDNFAVGGADGLRAYPNRFQVGDRRVIGVAEYRHITGWSPWSLVNTALTGFVETGRAWSNGADADTLVNVGAGLLLAPTRSSRAAVNRFDISIPLSSTENVDSFQIFIGSQINF